MGCNTPQDNTVPIGITSVFTSLLQSGHDVELFDTTFYNQGFTSSAELRVEALQFKSFKVTYKPYDMIEDFRKKIDEFKPEIIGFSILEVTYWLFEKLLNNIRSIIAENGIKIAVGGGHAIFWPESITKLDSVDFICIAEAEETFVELLNKISSGKSCNDQTGFWIRNGSTWIKNNPAKLVDINNLPFTDPSIFGDQYMMKPMMGKIRKTITIELSRGCPYKCTYCADPFLSDKFKSIGKWYRVKSTEKLEEEYAYLVNKYKPDFIYKFSETLLAAKNEWVNAYFSMYKKFSIPYWTESRPETINEKNVRRLAETNCTRFSMGLECGNEEYRKQYLKRGYSNKQIIAAASLLKKYKISFSMNLIIGFPFETRDIVFDGIKVLREAKPDGISTFLYTPYKGSELRTVCEENGMIERDFMGNDYFQMKYDLRNNNYGSEIVGLWRTIPLYVHLPESQYPFIKEAEKLTADGNKMFENLKIEYFNIMGW